ncbi:5638_t:CDS:2, partial [Diversispora eburnea]
VVNNITQVVNNGPTNGPTHVVERIVTQTIIQQVIQPPPPAEEHWTDKLVKIVEKAFLDNIVLHIPNIATFFVSILVSQVITTIYYAYNVFGRLQMELRQEVQFTPEEREMLAYDVPQTGAAASLISTVILTFVLTNVLVENQIQSLESILITH